MRSGVASALLLLGLLLNPLRAEAATIQFTAVDLPDAIQDQDLWQYAYRVSGYNFAANFGFSVFFGPTLYTALQDPPPPVNGDWGLLTLQPDSGLSADGLYDALALVDGASTASLFTLQFVWLGGPDATPGA